MQLKTNQGRIEQVTEKNPGIGAIIDRLLKKGRMSEGGISPSMDPMEPKMIIFYGAIGMAGAGIMLYLFYGNPIVSACLSPVGLFFIRYQREKSWQRQKRELKEQFKEGIYALSASLSAGRSIESAFADAARDLRILYPDEKTRIRLEFDNIVKQVALNVPVETALSAFAAGSGDEDIRNFSMVFMTAKRTGGNLVDIIRYTSTNIRERSAVVNAIEVMVSGKQYEQRMLAMLLPLMLAYMKMFSPAFLSSLYINAGGRVIMTLALGLYGISIFIGYKMTRIEV